MRNHKLKNTGISAQEDLARDRLNISKMAIEKYRFKNTCTRDGNIYSHVENKKIKIRYLNDLK